MNFKDEFSRQANDYKLFRPTYPIELFEFLSSHCHQHQLAWDCATGNGQAAISLTNFFSKVIATDASTDQLTHAVQHPKIFYENSAAEKSGLPNHSVDLITVATAIHWFQLNEFYAEAKRVLKPNGVIAVWNYSWSHITKSIDEIELKLGKEILKDYWKEGARKNQEGYAKMFFPFNEFQVPSFQAKAQWNLSQIMGWYNSWSATQNYITANNKNPVDLIKADLEKAWGNPEKLMEVKWQIFLRAGTV